MSADQSPLPPPAPRPGALDPEPAPPALPLEPPEVMYKTRAVDFLGRRTLIVYQNDNGPCPLLAICNVLLLKNVINLNPDAGEVSQQKLLSLIAERLIDSNSSAQAKDEEYVRNWEHNISDAMDLLPRLTTGIDVNVMFRKVDDFEFTRERAIFHLLDIPLYHGWIVDPQDTDTATAIGSKSYNALASGLAEFKSEKTAEEDKHIAEEETVDFSAATAAAIGFPSPSLHGRSFDESTLPDLDGLQIRRGDREEYEELRRVLSLSKAESTNAVDGSVSFSTSQSHSSSSIEADKTGGSSQCLEDGAADHQWDLIDNFLQSTANQLTVYGLFCLQKCLSERELSVFFRNNHFNTMFKYKGSLYLLATDQGFLGQTDLVWQKLDEVNGDGIFLTSNFTLFTAETPRNDSWNQQQAMTTTADSLAQFDSSAPPNSSGEQDPSSAPLPPPHLHPARGVDHVLSFMDVAAGQAQGHSNAARSRAASCSRPIQPLGSGPASSTSSTAMGFLPSTVAPTPKHDVVENIRPIYRISRHRPPSTALPRGRAKLSRETYRAQIKWWEDVQYWLKYLLKTISSSLSKSPDDLKTCFEITPVGKVQRPCGERQENDEWHRWDQQRLNRKSCNLETVFYGPSNLPDTDVPSVEDMNLILSFEESHRAYMMKHMGHLIHIKGLLERLILQAEDKMRGLIHNLKKLEEFPDFRRPKYSQESVATFPFQAAPAGAIHRGLALARYTHSAVSSDKQQDFTEGMRAMTAGFTITHDAFENFEVMGLLPELLQGIYAYGLKEPSILQQQAIVPICFGRDVILQGQSGIGKKTALLCGLLQRIDYSLLECQALILVQAPELAHHMQRVISVMGRSLGVKVLACVGRKEDRRILASGVHVVSGTPGYILDLIQKSYIFPRRIRILVLGKADLLCSQFDRIQCILGYLPSDIQLGLFSDALPIQAVEITRNLMNNPVLIAVKSQHSLLGLDQYYLDVENEEFKLDALLEIYGHFSIKEKTIVNVDAPNKVDLLTSQLRRMGRHRHEVLLTGMFRCLDLRQVAYVINYDIPQPAQYLQCVGHTGQFGKRHVVVNLVTLEQKQILKDIERMHQVVIKELPNSL